MKNTIKSELILEVASSLKNQKGFNKVVKKCKYNINQVDISIFSNDISKQINYEKGNYISLNFDELLYFDVKAKAYLSKKLISALKLLIKKDNLQVKKLLIVGLGNEKYACDSLGKLVTEKIFVTKPYLDKQLFTAHELCEVYAITTGVYGTTGLDSSVIVKNICNHIKPDVAIVVDSMIASDKNNLTKSIQISNTKLQPGGGVGNLRKEISYQTIGVPVLAIGVPLVISANTFCKGLDDLIVTPKDIESKVAAISKIIAKAINLTFNSITEQELLELTE